MSRKNYAYGPRFYLKTRLISSTPNTVVRVATHRQTNQSNNYLLDKMDSQGRTQCRKI
jgi:hypothetical protein